MRHGIIFQNLTAIPAKAGIQGAVTAQKTVNLPVFGKSTIRGFLLAELFFDF